MKIRTHITRNADFWTKNITFQEMNLFYREVTQGQERQLSQDLTEKTFSEQNEYIQWQIIGRMVENA